MSTAIEICSDGTIKQNYFAVGEVSWQSRFPSEMHGEWFRDDPDWELQSQLEDAQEEARSYAQSLSDERCRADDLADDLKDAESNLTLLQDEVRVYLAHLDDPEAIERLKAAVSS